MAELHTVTPWCRVAMISTGPPFFVATVGTPCAAACGGLAHSAHVVKDSRTACVSQRRIATVQRRWLWLPGCKRV